MIWKDGGVAREEVQRLSLGKLTNQNPGELILWSSCLRLSRHTLAIKEPKFSRRKAPLFFRCSETFLVSKISDFAMTFGLNVQSLIL